MGRVNQPFPDHLLGSTAQTEASLRPPSRLYGKQDCASAAPWVQLHWGESRVQHRLHFTQKRKKLINQKCMPHSLEFVLLVFL